jgi:hypothetical protein
MLIALLFMVTQSAYADDKTPSHGEHDHAAMMAMMAKPVAWTGYPILKTRSSGERREQMVITVVPQNIVAANIDAFSNNLKDEQGRRHLALEMAGAKLDKPATGGFHILTAREVRDNAVRVASSVYYFGERGAMDPTAMFMQQKNELEIIPQPFPREHARYRANEDWKFLVRFNGKPLANQKVNIETSNGSKVELLTDASGVLSLHVPDDFKAMDESKEVGGHNHGRPGAELVLATEYSDGGKSYLTAFNSSYGPNALDQRSLVMGLGFTLLGMLGAVPLLRQRKTAKNEVA